MTDGYCRAARRGRVAGAALLALLLTAACDAARVLGGLSEPSDQYVLTPKNTFSGAIPEVKWQLVVEEPVAAGGLNSARIVSQSTPTRLDYFARAVWTERAPRMVQTLLVESFENSGRITAVGRQAIGLRSDFNLKSELREFQAEFFDAETPATVRVRLNAKIIQQPGRSIIASETFEATAPAASNGMTDIVRAFDEALGRVLKRTVEWTLTTAEQSWRERKAS